MRFSDSEITEAARLVREATSALNKAKTALHMDRLHDAKTEAYKAVTALQELENIERGGTQ